MAFLDIQNIAFEIAGYQVSYVELIGTLFGFFSVYFASRANILTWVTGIVNEAFLFILFFQVGLYADMALQVYFFVVTLYGWYHWKQKPTQSSITTTGRRNAIYLAGVIVVGTVLSGFLFERIHLLLPQYFKTQASFPFADSFVMVLSIVATILLARKKVETWYLWIAADIVCVILFFRKGIFFLGFEYFVFLGLAIFGLVNWKKQLSNG